MTINIDGKDLLITLTAIGSKMEDKNDHAVLMKKHRSISENSLLRADFIQSKDNEKLYFLVESSTAVGTRTNVESSSDATADVTT